MKISTLFASILILCAFSSAQEGTQGNMGIGYSTEFNQLILRLGVAQYTSLELGLGLDYDDNRTDDELNLAISGNALIALHKWNNLTGSLSLMANITNIPGDNVGITFFGGYEPEILLWEHFALSAHFGLLIDIAPDVKLHTHGPNSNLLTGLKFMILL